MPIVSVVIPAFNRAGALAGAVRSVLAQSFRGFEVIIVDDGSSDDTPAVVADLAAQDARVFYHRHESNRGAQAARNTGIKAARAEWVAFLDSDDEWLPDSLEARLEVARTNGVDVVHSDCFVVENLAGERTPGDTAPFSGRVYQALLRTWGVFFPSLLVRRSALEQIDYLDESIISHQEWDTAIRLAKFNAFGFVDRPTFVYNHRSAGTVSSNKANQARGYRQIVEKHKKDILRIAGPKSLAQHYSYLARLYRAAGNEIEARRCNRLSKILRPFRRIPLNGAAQSVLLSIARTRGANE